jgi:hypothetical protein
MGYPFTVIPIGDLELFYRQLEILPPPIERQQALKLASCCLLVIQRADECLSGISEEKRCLAIWVRNQRASVRSYRFKGSSRYRGAMNADISNAADNAKNKLDWLRDQAPYCKSRATQRLLETDPYISRNEAYCHIPIFVEEVNRMSIAANEKRRVIRLLIIGAALLFLIPPLGLIFLLVAGVKFLSNRQAWYDLKKAEAERSNQLNEIKSIKTQGEFFESELAEVEREEIDESLPESLEAIASDLKRKYVFLDVACRDLNSKSLTWGQLASEILSEVNSPQSTNCDSKGSKKLEQAVGLHPPAPVKPTSKESLAIDFIQVMGDWHFEISIDQARSLLRELGYKRLPVDWNSISHAAEVKICQYLSSKAGANYADFYWRFEEGHVKAEKL